MFTPSGRELGQSLSEMDLEDLNTHSNSAIRSQRPRVFFAATRMRSARRSTPARQGAVRLFFTGGFKQGYIERQSPRQPWIEHGVVANLVDRIGGIGDLSMGARSAD